MNILDYNKVSALQEMNGQQKHALDAAMSMEDYGLINVKSHTITRDSDFIIITNLMELAKIEVSFSLRVLIMSISNNVTVVTWMKLLQEMYERKGSELIVDDYKKEFGEKIFTDLFMNHVHYYTSEKSQGENHRDKQHQMYFNTMCDDTLTNKPKRTNINIFKNLGLRLRDWGSKLHFKIIDLDYAGDVITFKIKETRI